MKKVLLGFPIFLVTFLAGYILVPEFRTMLTDQSPPQAVERVTQLNANSAPIVSSPKDEDFVPEFRDLPSLEEIDYPEPNDNLIDIFQIGSVYRESDVIAKTGESWLTLFEHNGNYSFKYAQAKVRHLKTASYAGDELDVRLTVTRNGRFAI